MVSLFCFVVQSKKLCGTALASSPDFYRDSTLVHFSFIGLLLKRRYIY